MAASPAHDVPSEALSKHIPGAASSEGGDAAVHDSSSSSSSSSDSDSDSDSEDEKSEMKTRTRSSAAEAQKVAVTEVKESTDGGQSGSGAPLTSGVEAAAQAAVEAPSVGSEKFDNPAPELCTTTENTRKVSSSDVSARDAAVPADAQVEADGEALTSEETQPASGNPPDVPPAEVASGAEASVQSAEEQVEPHPAVTEAAGEELQAEATPEHSEGTHHTTPAPHLCLSDLSLAP